MSEKISFFGGGGVVLILSTSHEDYAVFKDSIRATWMRDFENSGVKCFFYQGGAKSNYLEGDTINLACDDGLHYCAEKMRMAVQFLFNLKLDFKLLYRTNLSSYIDVPLFEKWVGGIDLSQACYMGKKGEKRIISEFFYRNKYIKYILDKLELGPSVSFASGAGMLLDRNSCLNIVNSNCYDRFVDDVMVGMCMRGTIINELDRFDLTEESDSMCTVSEFEKRVEGGLFHYRFKSSDRIKDAMLIQKFNDPSFRLSYCTENR